MNYRYYQDENFEDFACGRVICHRPGMTNFPVRLAGEIFRRSLEYSGKTSDICLYDPCCGGGYLLTVLGLLNSDTISRIIGSDIDEKAIALAKINLSLLTETGLQNRIGQLESLYGEYHKQSHSDALRSAEKFKAIIAERPSLPFLETFIADMLLPDALPQNFTADIVMTDVPYGNIADWAGDKENAITVLLDRVIPVLTHESIIAIVADKAQKIRNDKYIRLEKQLVGKRKFEILRLK